MIDDTKDCIASPEEDDRATGDEADETVSTAKLLASLCLHAALAPETAGVDDLAGGSSCAAIVQVPTAEWVTPVKRAARDSARWDLVVAPGDIRFNKKEEPSDLVASTLSRGGRVMGISQSPSRLLPSCLVSAADVTVRIEGVSDVVIASLIGAVAGTEPSAVPSALCLGLDFNDIVASVRQGSTAAECVARLSIARASKTVIDESLSRIPTLYDLHGYGDSMKWCLELVDGLKQWKAGKAPFPEASRVVLSGPPGTGKTTLVRSLAKTAELPLVATSVGSWFADSSGNLDGVIKEIARTFDTARALGTAIVLMDELDGLPDRATMDIRGKDWWTPVVNFVLTCLDSAVSGVTKNLVVVGATNHAESLDRALVRPGRLDRIIHVGLPETAEDRAAIFRTHLGSDITGLDLTHIGHASQGMTGAEIMACVRNARRRATSEARTLASADLLVEIVPPTSRTVADDRRCAIHEAGHAVVASALGFPVSTVNIVDRAGRGGEIGVERTAQTKIPTRADLERQVVLGMSGGAAEEVILGARSVGQGGDRDSDIGQCTRILAGLHASFGLGETLRYDCSPEMATSALAWNTALRRTVESDLARLNAATMKIVRDRRAMIEAVAAALLINRFMTGDQVQALLAGPEIAPSDDSKASDASDPTIRGNPDTPDGVERLFALLPSTTQASFDTSRRTRVHVGHVEARHAQRPGQATHKSQEPQRQAPLARLNERSRIGMRERSPRSARRRNQRSRIASRMPPST